MRWPGALFYDCDSAGSLCVYVYKTLKNMWGKKLKLSWLSIKLFQWHKKGRFVGTTCIINNWEIHRVTQVSCHSMWGTCLSSEGTKAHLFPGSCGLPGSSSGPLCLDRFPTKMGCGSSNLSYCISCSLHSSFPFNLRVGSLSQMSCQDKLRKPIDRPGKNPKVSWVFWNIKI